MTVQVKIPMDEYVRPNGFHETIQLPVECVDQAQADKLEAKLALLRKHNIDVTGELMGNQCNVCLDDGTFDYKFELFPQDGFTDKVRDLVLTFDEADYLRAKEMNEE